MTLEPYILLKLAHILLFVYWLGGDIGVFYSARFVRNSSYSLDARKLALKILGWIDQIPRYCLVLMLPVGYSLASEIGLVNLPTISLLLLWFIGSLWLGVVWWIHHYQGTVLAERLRSIDLVWRFILVAGLLWDSVQSLRGEGHIFAKWIAIKFMLFAAIIFCGIIIRILGKPLGPALRNVFANGSTPQLETIVQSTFAKTRPFVLIIWFLLVCAAYVGIAK